jgi:sugar phosphate permease
MDIYRGFNHGGGYTVNINDIGGRYSGILFGISNTFATIPGIVAPYIVAVLTPNKTQNEWKYVFYITACVFLIGGVVSQCLCGTDLEKWAECDDGETEEEATSMKTDLNKQRMYSFSE